MKLTPKEVQLMRQVRQALDGTLALTLTKENGGLRNFVLKKDSPQFVDIDSKDQVISK